MRSRGSEVRGVVDLECGVYGFRVSCLLCLWLEGGTLFDQEVAHGVEAKGVDDLVWVHDVAKALRHLLAASRG